MIPKFRAWIKSQRKMVPVARLNLLPDLGAGIEYLDNKGDIVFVPVKDYELHQALDIYGHSGKEFYQYDVIMSKMAIGVLVYCDGKLGLASWINGAYHCFCDISRNELEESEILGNIFEYTEEIPVD